MAKESPNKVPSHGNIFFLPTRRFRVEKKIKLDLCYDRDAPRFFSEVPQFGTLRHLPRTELENQKKNCQTDEKFHGLGTQREPRKCNCRISDEFRVKEPRHPEKKKGEKRYLYRSTRH